MLITNVSQDDVEKLKEIHKQNFPFPDINKATIARSIVDSGVLVGAGILKATTEGILIIDESLPVTMRVRAIRRLINDITPTAKFLGVSECHVFVKSEKMGKFLKEIGFRECIGKAMVLDL